MGGWNKYEVPEGTKYCPTCKNIKPLESFPHKRGATGDRDGYCTPCKVERARATRHKHRNREDPTLAKRFAKYVTPGKPDECWLWTGALRNGYGVITENNRSIGAHRIALKFAGVKLPDSRTDRVVDHTCRVRRCVNPAHLRLVTERVNALENNDSAVATVARKYADKCKAGHPWTEDNTIIYIQKGGKNRHGNPTKPKRVRICKACRRARRPNFE